jgi:ribulose kinase
MKTWQAAVLVILVVTLPVLSACDLLGIGGKKASDQELYEQWVKAIQEQQEADRKAQEEYYRQIQEALNNYSQQYSEYQQQELQRQLEAARAAQEAASGQTGGQ